MLSVGKIGAAALSVSARVLLKKGGGPVASAYVSSVRQGALAVVPNLGSVQLDHVSPVYWVTSAGAPPGTGTAGLQGALLFTASYTVAASWPSTARTAAFEGALKGMAGLAGGARLPGARACRAGGLANSHFKLRCLGRVCE